MPTKVPPRRVRLSDETSDFSPLLGFAAALLALLVVLAEAQAMSPPGEGPFCGGAERVYRAVLTVAGASAPLGCHS